MKNNGDVYSEEVEKKKKETKSSKFLMFRKNYFLNIEFRKNESTLQYSESIQEI